MVNQFVFMNDMAMNQFKTMVMDRQINFKFLLDIKGVHDWKIMLLVYIGSGQKCDEFLYIYLAVC